MYFFQMLSSLCDIYDEILRYRVVSYCAYLFWKRGYLPIRVNKVNLQKMLYLHSHIRKEDLQNRYTCHFNFDNVVDTSTDC